MKNLDLNKRFQYIFLLRGFNCPLRLNKDHCFSFLHDFNTVAYLHDYEGYHHRNPMLEIIKVIEFVNMVPVVIYEVEFKSLVLNELDLLTLYSPRNGYFDAFKIPNGIIGDSIFYVNTNKKSEEVELHSTNGYHFLRNSKNHYLITELRRANIYNKNFSTNPDYKSLYKLIDHKKVEQIYQLCSLQSKN